MKQITILFFMSLLSSLTASLASAEVILERELVNALNGESTLCRIHQDTTVEIINDGTLLGTHKVALEASEVKVLGWIREMALSPEFKKVASTPRQNIEVLKPEVTTRYTHRGLKVYSVYENGLKVPYYRLRANTQRRPRGRSRMTTGSAEFKIPKNYQQLRGQTDLACRQARAAL